MVFQHGLWSPIHHHHHHKSVNGISDFHASSNSSTVPPPWQWQFTNLIVGYILHLRWPWQGQSPPPWRCCFRPPGCCAQPDLCGCSCAVPGKTSHLPPDTHKTSQVWGSLHLSTSRSSHAAILTFTASRSPLHLLLLIFSTSLSAVGNSGRLTWVRHSSHNSSAI